MTYAETLAHFGSAGALYRAAADGTVEQVRAKYFLLAKHGVPHHPQHAPYIPRSWWKLPHHARFEAERIVFQEIGLVDWGRPDTSPEYGGRASAIAAYEVEFLVPAAALPAQRARRKKKTKPKGAPREYDHEAVRQAAENYIKDNGLPRSNELLMEKVEDALGPKAPKKTWLKKLISPIFKREDAKRKKAKRGRDKLKSH